MQEEVEDFQERLLQVGNEVKEEGQEVNWVDRLFQDRPGASLTTFLAC
jgi:hypothetical protein